MGRGILDHLAGLNATFPHQNNPQILEVFWALLSSMAINSNERVIAELFFFRNDLF